MATTITNTAEYAAATEVADGKQVVVDFWAEWCGPCRALSPTLDKMEAEGLIHLVKVNVDHNPELAMQNNIQSIPTLVFFKDGAENLAPMVGAYPRPAIEQHINR